MKKAVTVILILILLGIFLFSGWKVLTIIQEYRQGEEAYTAIADAYVQLTPQPSHPETEPPSDTSPSGEVETIPAETVHILYETPPISVDFDALLADCPDVVGWIYCADTPINYPIVQAQDNKYYLRRLWNGTYNSSGSLFMDYRCVPDFSGWNSVIYGHNMLNGTMFGTLQKYKKQEYYNAHPTLYLLTPTRNYRIDLIGGYTTPGTAEDTYGLPQTQEGRDELIAKARQNSTFQTDTAVNAGERLITLSTCAYDYRDARYVLVGVLRPLALSESTESNG